MNVWESVGQVASGSGKLAGSEMFKASLGIFTLTLSQPTHSRRVGLGWTVQCDPPIFPAREFPFKELPDAKESAALLLAAALSAAGRAVDRLMASEVSSTRVEPPAVVEPINACCVPDAARCEATWHKYRVRLHWSNDRTTVTRSRDEYTAAYSDAQMIIDRDAFNPVRVVTSTLEEYIEPMGWTEAFGYEDALRYRAETADD